MKRPVWNYPGRAGMPLKDLIRRVVLLELHSSYVFDVVLKTGIMSISPGCLYESTEELVQHIHASNSLTPARSE